MATYRELVSLVLDEVKINSDDSFITQEHAIFLLKKYRAYVLKQWEEKHNEQIDQSNAQVLCLELEQSNIFDGMPCEGVLLKSTEKIPSVLTNSGAELYIENFFYTYIEFVPKERLRYVGHNKWLQNIIYASISPDNYLYLKSSNPQFIYLENAQLTAVFEDSEEAAELECEEGLCDILDWRFPLQEDLQPTVVQYCVKELLGVAYRPKDNFNNASDDLSEIATYLRNNMKSKFQKQMDNDD